MKGVAAVHKFGRVPSWSKLRNPPWIASIPLPRIDVTMVGSDSSSSIPGVRMAPRATRIVQADLASTQRIAGRAAFADAGVEEPGPFLVLIQAQPSGTHWTAEGPA